jgi:hypothetical protein
MKTITEVLASYSTRTGSRTVYSGICSGCNDHFYVEARSFLDKRKANLYCSISCHMKHRKPAWKGGRHINHEGYVRLTLPDGRRVLEHRYVVEKRIGRELRRGEIVHHINEIRDDNRDSNLMLLKSVSEHRKIHTKKTGG